MLVDPLRSQDQLYRLFERDGAKVVTHRAADPGGTVDYRTRKVDGTFFGHTTERGCGWMTPDGSSFVSETPHVYSANLFWGNGGCLPAFMEVDISAEREWKLALGFSHKQEVLWSFGFDVKIVKVGGSIAGRHRAWELHWKSGCSSLVTYESGCDSSSMFQMILDASIPDKVRPLPFFGVNSPPLAEEWTREVGRQPCVPWGSAGQPTETLWFGAETTNHGVEQNRLLYGCRWV